MSRFPVHTRVMRIGAAAGLHNIYTVLGTFQKLSGKEFIVVEDDFGRLHIYKPELLIPLEEKKS